MKAVGYTKSLPISDAQSLADFETAIPEPKRKDLLVEIKAIAVNPVDMKIRQRVAADPGETKIIGWDASGIVKAVGSEVKHFKVGDEVYYAGDLLRPGCNAEYQLVDERIVGHKPHSLNFAEAAALPLTSLTAWELLFDRMGISPEASTTEDSILIIGAAGGVGSIACQLLKNLTDLSVVGSASRLESKIWLKDLGCDFVIDHSEALGPQIDELEINPPTYAISLNQTEMHYQNVVDLMKPQGVFGLIDDPETFDIRAFKQKSISVHWEFMYTRSMFGTEDMGEQGHILNQVASLVDQGKIRTTVQKHLGKICANNLREAHALMESGRSIGKVVLEGF